MTAMRDVEVLRAACCIAGADGEIESDEAGYLQQLAQKAGVGAASLSAMMELAANDSNFRQQQFRVLKSDPVATMELLFSIALADGEVTSDEGELLRLFAARLELGENRGPGAATTQGSRRNELDPGRSPGFGSAPGTTPFFAFCRTTRYTTGGTDFFSLLVIPASAGFPCLHEGVRYAAGRRRPGRAPTIRS